ncbi:hypothetical protein F5146DRAFT_1008134 [Armillaria mellea]|nr:hypothetical protein F5146DRAFT_1008134 [Armillaria mellea]
MAIVEIDRENQMLPQLLLKRNEMKLGSGGTPSSFGVYHSSFTSFIEDANSCLFHNNPQLGDVYLHHVTQADGYQIFIYYGGSKGWVKADEKSPLVHPAEKHSNRRLALRGGFATPNWMLEVAEVDHLLELREVEMTEVLERKLTTCKHMQLITTLDTADSDSARTLLPNVYNAYPCDKLNLLLKISSDIIDWHNKECKWAMANPQSLKFH